MSGDYNARLKHHAHKVAPAVFFMLLLALMLFMLLLALMLFMLLLALMLCCRDPST